MNPWGIIGAFALVVALSLGAYKHGVDTTTTKYELQITVKDLADAKLREKTRSENEAVIVKLQGEKHDAQKRIDDLAADNKRYRVLLPGCRRVVPVSNAGDAASGSTQAPTGGEPLPREAETAQGALDAFMGESDGDAHEMDSLVNECRIVYKWAKDLGR